MSRIDFIPYPPTSFPVRDLLVLEHLPITQEDSVCEVGIGSGQTAVRLCKLGRSVTGFDISGPTVEALRYLEGRYRNLHLVTADVTQPEVLSTYEGQFTRLVSCDTLEHVTDPGAYFGSIGRLLAPGGRFLITFPNEPRERMHGITRFEDVESLAGLMTAAGLVPEQIGAAVLSPEAQGVAERLGRRPVQLVRNVLTRLRGSKGPKESVDAAAPPQTFEETRFFRHMGLWRQLSPAVNLYWYMVLKRMEQKGRCFEIDPRFYQAPFEDCQVCLIGRKPGRKPAQA